VRISIAAEVGAAYAPFVRAALCRAASFVARAPQLREFSVVLVGDRRMGALHEQFMGVAGPTDVLTFPIDADAIGNVIAGEVYVCVPEARRQAKSRGIDPKREVLLYALHGMLHLLGYDDRTSRDYRIMHSTEDLILTELGLGPVFAPPTPLKPPKTMKKKGAKRR
jgi:probable rRNA maturation factor